MRSKILPRLASYIVLLVCLISGSSQSVAQPLRWNLAAGEQFSVTFLQRCDSTTRVTDRTTSIDSETELKMDWTVLEIDDEQNAKIEQAISAVRLVVGDPAQPGKTISLDTTSKETPTRLAVPILKQVNPLIGLKFMTTMTPRGEIQEILIPEETMKVLQQLPGSLNLRELFSEGGINELMGAAAVVLPETELQSGASWNNKSTVINEFGEFSRIRSYKFIGTEVQGQTKLASFVVETTMEPVAETPKPESPTLVEFSESGTMKFDSVAGYFVASEIKNNITTEIPYREKTITTTSNSVIQMSIEKK